MSVAKSNIALYKVDFSPTNQIDFQTKEEQDNFFNTLNTKKIVRNCSHIKRGQTLRVRGYVEREFDIFNYGYYENYFNDSLRRYYFWIVSKRYLAKNVTELEIVVDAFQTYLFEWNFRECFIERETTYSDGFGEHTLPEDVELGDYMEVYSREEEYMKGDLSFFMGITDYEEKHIGSIFGKMYNGYALKYYETDDIVQLNNDIIALSDAGKADAILFIYSFPTRFFTRWCEENGIEKPKSGGVIGSIHAFLKVTETLTNAESFINGSFVYKKETYIAENKKLNCFPYTVLEVSAPNGSNIVLKVENFDNVENIQFRIDTTLSPNPIFSAVPLNYCRDGFNISESIETSGYGLCSWNNDTYSNWYAQQSAVLKAQSENISNSYKTAATIVGNQRIVGNLNNQDTAIRDTTNATLSALSSIFSGDIMGGAKTALANANTSTSNFAMANRNVQNEYMNASLLNQQSYQNDINLLTASVQSASIQPNTCKGDTSSTNLDVSRETCTFRFRIKKIKPEYARIIDKKFKMFGYKVNRIGLPSKNNRNVFDYIKTVGCQIVGDLRQEDKNMIEQMFDNGLRIWHDYDKIYNYTVKNNPKGGS